MPYLSPESLGDAKKPGPGGLRGFFAPLKVLSPQTVRLGSGAVRKHYGVLFLCCGVFLGVVRPRSRPPGGTVADVEAIQLATGYAPILLQMYATAVFGFTLGNNGWLMSANAFMRSVFLIFLFPRIIRAGRNWFSLRARQSSPSPSPVPGVVLPTDPRTFDAPAGTQAEVEPVVPEAIDERAAYAFDLFFLRWSLLVDGVLTTGAAFATRGWHAYLGPSPAWGPL